MPFEPGRELRLLLAALQFMTRLPVAPSSLDPDWLARSAKYFPLVGILVGTVAAAVLAGAATLWPVPLPALLAVGAVLLLTGALHEDGLADCADSLGGRTREARLAIMKDPRLGVFGALALLLAIGVSVGALSSLPVRAAAAALVASHAGGRLAAVLVMATSSYAGDRAASKVEHGSSRPWRGEVAVAALFGLVPLLLLAPERAVLGLALGAAAAGILAVFMRRTLGGYTGDVLGATIASFAVGFLLGASTAWGPA